MIQFPDPNTADEYGLLAIGGNFEIETLRLAYSQGIFPWPQAGHTYLWFSPPERGIIEFKDFHVPKSLAKEIKQKSYRFTFNENFKEVIENCANVPRPNQPGTWITKEIIESYTEFHKAGFAHSIECWETTNLVAGLYGVWVGGVFMAESMFYKKSNASKICLVQLAEFLKSKGHSWMDIQMVTPVLELMGGKYISRAEFLPKLKSAQLENSFESLKFPRGYF